MDTETRPQIDLLIDRGTILTMNPHREIIEDGFVAIKGGEILDVGKRDRARRKYQTQELIDADKKLVMPGLINAHTHVAMSLFRGIADDRSLMDWLQNYIFPAEAQNVNQDFVRIGTSLACWEMIQSGTTTFADMYFFENEIAAVAQECGMRAVVGQGIVDAPTPDSRNSDEGLVLAEALIQGWKDNKLIYPAIAPHAPYSCEPKTLAKAKRLADKHGVRILTHLAESQHETNIIRQQYGASPVQHLRNIGFLEANVVAAHCIWVNDEDISILKDRGCGIVHCPESNMKLASGIAPVVKFLKTGLKLGLGTDAPAANNDLDMFQEMGSACRLQKVVNLDPTVLDAKQTLEMSTLGSAHCLNLQQEIGSIETGKKADIIILSLDEPNELPLYDLYSHLVYSVKACNVMTSVINGQIVMKDRKVLSLDQEGIRKEARKYASSIQKSIRR